MSEPSAVFTRENIDQYFKELSKVYKKLGGRNVPVEIILIGGAAIIEGYGFRDMTTDIDAIMPSMGIMKDAINRVGDQLGLPNGWLNADFMKTSSYSPKLAAYSKPYKTFNQVLRVRYVTGEYLIAMKLKAGRRYKNDLSDIVGILAEHERKGCPIAWEALSRAVTDLYGGWDAIDEKSAAFIRAILDNRKYEEIYAAIREDEKNAKSVLIAFQARYPGALDGENADSILENAERSGESRAAVLQTLERLKKQEKQP